MANSIDPDETAHNEPSHQDLHCLQNMYWSAGPKALIYGINDIFFFTRKQFELTLPRILL